MKNKYLIQRNNGGAMLLVLAILALVLAEVFALFSSRANNTYAIIGLDAVMIFTEVAVVFLVIVFFLSVYLKGKAFMLAMDLLRALAVALVCACLFIVLEQRATLMGYVWFSDLESGNVNSVNALNYGVASAAFYAVALIVMAITGGFELVSYKKVKRTPEVIQDEIAALQQELADMKK